MQHPLWILLLLPFLCVALKEDLSLVLGKEFDDLPPDVLEEIVQLGQANPPPSVALNLSSIYSGSFKAADWHYSKNVFTRSRGEAMVLAEMGYIHQGMAPIRLDLLLRVNRFAGSSMVRLTCDGLYESHEGMIVAECRPSIASAVDGQKLPLLANTSLESIERIAVVDESRLKLAPPLPASFSKEHVYFSQCEFKWFGKVSTTSRATPLDISYWNNGPPVVVLRGILSSTSCGLIYSVDLEGMPSDVYSQKRLFYIVWASIILCVDFLERWIFFSSIESRRSATNYAKLSSFIECLRHAYLSLIHVICALMTPALFGQFAFLATLSSAQVLLIEMPLIMRILRLSSYPRIWSFLHQASLRFYLTIVGGILFMQSHAWLIPLVVIASHADAIPQIIMHTNSPIPARMPSWHQVVQRNLRLGLPLYFYLWPSAFWHADIQDNFMAVVDNDTIERDKDTSSMNVNIPWNILFMVLLCLWVNGQQVLLYGQAKWGNRFFIPNRLAHVSGRNVPRYSYAIPSGSPSVTEQLSTLSCAVCLEILRASTAVGDSMMDEESLAQFMITPCGHIFHRHCLLRWLEERLLCPTCRHSLPEP
jgi:hypothetical protein